MLSALVNEAEGLSSEPLQRVVALAATELRAVLVTEGPLVRHGQARGTRYQLPVARKRRPAAVPLAGETPFPMPVGLMELPKPVEAPAPEPEPVPVEMLNELRGHLASSGTALLLSELEKLSGLSRLRLRQAMGQLLEMGLVTKEGRGVGCATSWAYEPCRSRRRRRVQCPQGG